MFKYGRVGLGYDLKTFKPFKWQDDEVTGFSIILELTVINKKTNKEILFITKDDKVPTACIKAIKSLNKNYDISNYIFFAEYINVALKNNKIEVSIKNKELSEFDLVVSCKIKEATKIVNVGKREVAGIVATIIEEKKINSKEFYMLIGTNNFSQREELLLKKNAFYEVDINS